MSIVTSTMNSTTEDIAIGAVVAGDQEQQQHPDPGPQQHARAHHADARGARPSARHGARPSPAARGSRPTSPPPRTSPPAAARPARTRAAPAPRGWRPGCGGRASGGLRSGCSYVPVLAVDEVEAERHPDGEADRRSCKRVARPTSRRRARAPRTRSAQRGGTSPRPPLSRRVAAHPCVGPVLAALNIRRAQAVCQKRRLCDNPECMLPMAANPHRLGKTAKRRSCGPLALWHVLAGPRSQQTDRPQVPRLQDLEQVDDVHARCTRPAVPGRPAPPPPPGSSRGGGWGRTGSPAPAPTGCSTSRTGRGPCAAARSRCSRSGGGSASGRPGRSAGRT